MNSVGQQPTEEATTALSTVSLPPTLQHMSITGVSNDAGIASSPHAAHPIRSPLIALCMGGLLLRQTYVAHGVGGVGVLVLENVGQTSTIFC